MININRTQLEIHPKNGLTMNMITDRWIRICIGIAIIGMYTGVFLLLATPFIHAIGWW